MTLRDNVQTVIVGELALDGADALVARLGRLARDLRQSIAAEAVAAAGAVFLNTMRALAPDDTLRRSIELVVRSYPDHDVTMALVGPTWPDGAHGPMRELGTQERFTRAGHYRGRMRATPFVGPTFDAYRGDAQEALAASLADSLAREAA
jgi:hypothetical protein